MSCRIVDNSMFGTNTLYLFLSARNDHDYGNSFRVSGQTDIIQRTEKKNDDPNKKC